MNQPIDLDRIEARANAATPGPWDRYPQYGAHFYANTTGEHLIGIGDLNFGDGEQADADEAFVRHAREDVDALLAEVRRLRAELAAVHVQAIRDLADKADPQRPEISFFGDHGHEVGAWMRKQAQYAERAAAAAVPAVPTTTKDGGQ